MAAFAGENTAVIADEKLSPLSRRKNRLLHVAMSL